MTILIHPVDYRNPAHGKSLIDLLNHYATDPAGGGRPLSEKVRQRLPVCLSQIDAAFSFLAVRNEESVGLINCFEGFSTFSCAPLVNIHDLVVHRDHRGQGIGRQLLQAVEMEAIARGCCKITLEVLAQNQPARTAYRKFGFEGYELDPAMGQAIFLEKKLALQEH